MGEPMIVEVVETEGAYEAKFTIDLAGPRELLELLIADGVSVHGLVQPISVFSSDTGGKKAPALTDQRQGVVETGR